MPLTRAAARTLSQSSDNDEAQTNNTCNDAEHESVESAEWNQPAGRKLAPLRPAPSATGEPVTRNPAAGRPRGPKTYIHHIPIPSPQELQQIRKNFRRERERQNWGIIRDHYHALQEHWAQHYGWETGSFRLEMDYAELIRTIGQYRNLSVVDKKNCDRCCAKGSTSLCGHNGIDACVKCVKANTPCTLTDRHTLITNNLVGTANHQATDLSDPGASEIHWHPSQQPSVSFPQPQPPFVPRRVPPHNPTFQHPGVPAQNNIPAQPAPVQQPVLQRVRWQPARHPAQQQQPPLPQFQAQFQPQTPFPNQARQQQHQQLPQQPGMPQFPPGQQPGFPGQQAAQQGPQRAQAPVPPPNVGGIIHEFNLNRHEINKLIMGHGELWRFVHALVDRVYRLEQHGVCRCRAGSGAKGQGEEDAQLEDMPVSAHHQHPVEFPPPPPEPKELSQPQLTLEEAAAALMGSSVPPPNNPGEPQPSMTPYPPPPSPFRPPPLRPSPAADSVIDPQLTTLQHPSYPTGVGRGRTRSETHARAMLRAQEARNESARRQGTANRRRNARATPSALRARGHVGITRPGIARGSSRGSPTRVKQPSSRALNLANNIQNIDGSEFASLVQTPGPTSYQDAGFTPEWLNQAAVGSGRNDNTGSPLPAQGLTGYPSTGLSPQQSNSAGSGTAPSTNDNPATPDVENTLMDYEDDGCYLQQSSDDEFPLTSLLNANNTPEPAAPAPEQPQTGFQAPAEPVLGDGTTTEDDGESSDPVATDESGDEDESDEHDEYDDPTLCTNGHPIVYDLPENDDNREYDIQTEFDGGASLGS
ncbi:hypothetical protein BDW62DRAFT_205991 [Aspergillus aurantiobrunneus]